MILRGCYNERWKQRGRPLTIRRSRCWTRLNKSWKSLILYPNQSLHPPPSRARPTPERPEREILHRETAEEPGCLGVVAQIGASTIAGTGTVHHCRCKAHNADETVEEEFDEAQIAIKRMKQVHRMMEKLDTRLIDKLDEALNAKDQSERANRHAEAAGIIKEYKAFVDGDALLAAIDSNGFMNSSIRTSLVSTLELNSTGWKFLANPRQPKATPPRKRKLARGATETLHSRRMNLSLWRRAGGLSAEKNRNSILVRSPIIPGLTWVRCRMSPRNNKASPASKHRLPEVFRGKTGEDGFWP